MIDNLASFLIGGAILAAILVILVILAVAAVNVVLEKGDRDLTPATDPEFTPAGER